MHFITQGDISWHSHEALAEAACQCGVKWVQLRIKDQRDEEVLKTAMKVRAICNTYGAQLIINDRPDIAKAVQADGVHLGKNDVLPSHARNILGENAIIGGTANTIDDVLRIMDDCPDIDYFGIGPFRFTPTKKNLSPILGLEGYRRLLSAMEACHIKVPVIAIGGILPEDIRPLTQIGVHGVAMAAVINKALNKKKIIQHIHTELRHETIENS